MISAVTVILGTARVRLSLLNVVAVPWGVPSVTSIQATSGISSSAWELGPILSGGRQWRAAHWLGRPGAVPLGGLMRVLRLLDEVEVLGDDL